MLLEKSQRSIAIMQGAHTAPWAVALSNPDLAEAKKIYNLLKDIDLHILFSTCIQNIAITKHLTQICQEGTEHLYP